MKTPIEISGFFALTKQEGKKGGLVKILIKLHQQ